jgi:glycosyltransferase involved in cell wall biosynthesis
VTGPAAPTGDAPVVSVVMPFLNAERFIAEAIESVLAQTYGSWELLLVDDGSTDRGPAIARGYAAERPGQLYCLSHPGGTNRGASASRNLGLARARGRYIAFLDADDVWLPTKLADQVPLLDAHPEAAMLYGFTQSWYSWTGRPEDRDRDHVPPLGVEPDQVVAAPKLFVLFLRQRARTPCTCSVLIRREALERVGGFEEAFRYIYTDQVLYAKLTLRDAVFVARGCWDRYRRHPDSSCFRVKASGEGPSARLTYLDWVVKHLRANRVDDPEIWRAVRREFLPYRHPVLYRVLRKAKRAVAAFRSSRITPPVRSMPWTNQL